MFSSLRNTIRLFTIIWVLARHDVFAMFAGTPIARPGQWLGRMVGRKHPTRSHGRSLAEALQRLGPVYIKLGQALSTRADLIGEDIARDLTRLQDKLPPFPFEKAQEIIEEELGAALFTQYKEFSREAVAAASIAQVHKAVTMEGAEVAVKIVRPDVEAAFTRDLDFLYWCAEIIERRVPSSRRLRLVDTIAMLERTVVLEMDLRYEAAAASELADNMADNRGFRVPTIDWARTSTSVLTLEWIDGIPLHDRTALVEAGHDLELIVENAAAAFFSQVYRDGFFHADLHPGNVFVDADSNIVAVDFGIMGRLDKKTRMYLAGMLHSFLTRDYRRVAELHFEAGYVPADQSVEEFTQACRSIAEPILGRPLNEISASRLMAQLFAVAEAFQMRTQPHLLLLQKSMMLTEGIGRRLYPEANMWTLAEPLIRPWLREQFNPMTIIRERVQESAALLNRLPDTLTRLERVLQHMDEGGLRVHPDTLDALTGRRKHKTDFMFMALLFALVLVGILYITGLLTPPDPLWLERLTTI